MDVKAFLFYVQTISLASLVLERKLDASTLKGPWRGGEKLKWKSSNAIKHNLVQVKYLVITPSAQTSGPSAQKENYKPFKTRPSGPFIANQVDIASKPSAKVSSSRHPASGSSITVDQSFNSKQIETAHEEIHNSEEKQMSYHPFADATQNLYVFISLLATLAFLLCMCVALHYYYKPRGCLRERFRSAAPTEISRKAKEESCQYAIVPEDTNFFTKYSSPELIIRSTAQIDEGSK